MLKNFELFKSHDFSNPNPAETGRTLPEYRTESWIRCIPTKLENYINQKPQTNKDQLQIALEHPCLHHTKS